MSADRTRSPRRARDERGAVALMMALCLVAVLIAAGLVIDFGIARYHREANTSAADAAAMAGVQALDVGDGLYHPWKGVCTALAYLQANDPQLSTITGSYSTGSGGSVSGTCSGASVPTNNTCTANTPSTWAWFQGTSLGGTVAVEIRSGYAMPDPRFTDDTALAGDSGATALGGCDQLAVIITESEKPGAGSLATSSDLVTRVRSVARLMPNSTGAGPVALLLLERHSCQALAAGSTNTYFDILGNGTSAGTIHADSLGDGSLCNGGGKVLFGKFAKHIIARHAETGGAAGSITTVALSSLPGAVPGNASDGSANVCAEQSGGSCAGPAARGIIGRAPIDTRYLNGVHSAMSTAATAMAWSTATATANGYTVWTPASCNNQAGTPPAAGSPSPNSATKLFVNCPGGITFKDFTIANATNVIVNGTVGIGSNNTLAIPNAQRVYIKGATGGTGLSVNGSLALNTGTTSVASNSGSSPICATRAGAGRDQLVIGNGAFAGGAQANFHMCNTTVLMADGWNGASCPLPPAVTPLTTEPADNTCRGYISLGGGGFMEWTAPNLVTTTAAQTDWDALEDLALWTETSGTISASTENKIGGGGTMTLTGVIFLPNANPFTISGGGLQNNGANAQFITRRLEANGNGTLYMRPNLPDSITIPLTPSYALVR